MKWSAPLVVASIGIRAGAVQVEPSPDVLITRSFAGQPERKLQSSQTTYVVPVASICAEGSDRVLRPPATVCALTAATCTSPPQLVPPLVEVNDWSALEFERNGTTTVPFGCTSGWPPSPPGVPAGANGADQVNPPSVEVLINTRLLLLLSSHSI